MTSEICYTNVRERSGRWMRNSEENVEPFPFSGHFSVTINWPFGVTWFRIPELVNMIDSTKLLATV